MKPSVFVLLAALFVAQASPAQFPSIRTSGVVQTGSAWEEVVTNLSTSPIVTLHAMFDCIDADGHRVGDPNGGHDSLYQYSRDRDIPPGDRVTIRVSGYAHCSGGVDAVIFSDGHSEGDPEVIAGIYQQRQGLYKGLQFVVPLLGKIAAGQSTTGDAIAILDKRARSVSHDMTRDMEARSGETTIYGSVLADLRRQSDFSVPSDFTPKHQPRVEDLAKAKNIPRELALATVLANKYSEWLAALEGHTKPPEER